MSEDERDFYEDGVRCRCNEEGDKCDRPVRWEITSTDRDGESWEDWACDVHVLRLMKLWRQGPNAYVSVEVYKP